jgi:histidinol-phosphatase
MSPELTVALEAAKRAATISRGYYRGNFSVKTKADKTPVTQADVECEEAIRQTLLAAFPEYGFHGEETGQSNADAGCLWLVDPIDGTKSFIRGYPFFSTQIALMKNGELVLGVSSSPMFDEVAWAERGNGAWLNGAALQVSDAGDVAVAAISTGNLKSLAASKGWSQLGEIVKQADRMRGYGDFYHYHLLAAGKIDAVIESDVNILDIAALAVIVQEAGAVFSDLNGNSPSLDTRSVLAANPAMHKLLLSKLKGFIE